MVLLTENKSTTHLLTAPSTTSLGETNAGMTRNDTYQNLPKYDIPPTAFKRKDSFPGELLLPNRQLQVPTSYSPGGYRRKVSEDIYLKPEQVQRIYAARKQSLHQATIFEVGGQDDSFDDVPPPTPCAGRNDSMYFDMQRHSTDPSKRTQHAHVPHIVVTNPEDSNKDDYYVPCSPGHSPTVQFNPAYVNTDNPSKDEPTDDDVIYFNLAQMQRLQRKESYPGDIILPPKYAKKTTAQYFTNESNF